MTLLDHGASRTACTSYLLTYSHRLHFLCACTRWHALRSLAERHAMAAPDHPRRPTTAHSSRERMPLGYRGGLWAGRRGVACGSGVRKVVGSRLLLTPLPVYCVLPGRSGWWLDACPCYTLPKVTFVGWIAPRLLLAGSCRHRRSFWWFRAGGAHHQQSIF
jgi:hypothetical protein